MPNLSADRNLPHALVQIRLGSALSACGVLEVKDTFDKSATLQLFVYDDRQLGYTDWVDTEPEFKSKCFIVKNPNNTTIVSLPLDGRTITGPNVTKGGVCDAMLLTEKEMSLVEFKTNVTSENYQTIMDRANDAVKQLWHTYDDIIKPRCAKFSKDIDVILTVDFYVVFDNDMEITGASSQLMDMQNQFLEDCKHLLYFENEKTFSVPRTSLGLTCDL